MTMIAWGCLGVGITREEGFSSDTTFCDTSWVPPVFARPFGNCWLPLWFWPLIFPQLLNFVLTVHVFNLSIFMSRVPLPLLISGQNSSSRLSTMEEATMNEEMFAEAPGATTFTLYIPNFLREYSLSEQSLEEQKNELLRKDWLTSGLIQRSRLMTTTSVIQLPSNTKSHNCFLLDVSLLDLNSLTKPPICS
jgi:hypothetical protein